MAATGKRHPLLVYQRLFGAWRWPALLIAGLCGLLWWLAPPPLDTFAPQLALAAAAGVALLLCLYTFIGPRLAYVQCMPNHLRVSTPLFRLAISYSRIRTARPMLFEAGAVRGGRGWAVEPFLGRTALAVDLNRYPVSARWLRLWLHESLLLESSSGLVLVTPDWMALSRDIEVHRADWKTRRRDQERADGLTSLTPRRH